MKLSTITCMILGSASVLLGETWTGTLVDTMCKDKDLATHTRKCAIACSKSGYGLMTSDGKFVKFDEAGSAKALSALNASSKDTDLKAKVTGSMNGDMIQVESIELQ